jgi:GNAT superfamily N-acetyltransferase
MSSKKHMRDGSLNGPLPASKRINSERDSGDSGRSIKNETGFGLSKKPAAPLKIELFKNDTITEKHIEAASQLFTEHYGVWGPLAIEKLGRNSTGHGTRVRMPPKKVHKQLLPSGKNITNIYIRLLSSGQLIGNLFATHWDDYSEPSPYLWITQLCVHSDHRNQGIAKQLLSRLRPYQSWWREGSNRGIPVGILSPSPFAIAAVLRVFGREGLAGFDASKDFQTTKEDARKIMDSCPVSYVKGSRLKGELFNLPKKHGAISCAKTGFWVDHKETLNALKILKRRGVLWPLGELPEGSEFLVVLKGIYKDMPNQSTIIETFEDESITNDMVAEAAKLYTGHYGLWGPLAAEKMDSNSSKQGKTMLLTYAFRPNTKSILPIGRH